MREDSRCARCQDARLKLSVWMQKLDNKLAGDANELRQRNKTKNETSWNVLREDRADHPILTEYFHSDGAITMYFIVDGDNAVDSLGMCSTIPWNMVVTAENTTLAYNSLRMSTSHFMKQRKEVSWNPLTSLLVKLGCKKISRKGNV